MRKWRSIIITDIKKYITVCSILHLYHGKSIQIAINFGKNHKHNPLFLKYIIIIITFQPNFSETLK